MFRRKRLWSSGREGVYQVCGEIDKHDPLSGDSKTHQQPQDSKTRPKLKSKSNSYSLEAAADDATKLEQISRASSVDDSAFEMNGNGLHESSESLIDEDDNWSLLSADENAVRLLSSHRKGSVALDQILLDETLDRQDSNVQKMVEKDVDPDLKDIVAAIRGERDSDASDVDSDSGSSTAVSDTSDLEEVTSDEESEVELDQEAFDIDAHINKLVTGKDTDSDSDSDGNESEASEKAFQKAVRKVIKKIKRERSEEIVDSGEESEASEKGSETEEPSTSDADSASEDDDDSDASSAKSDRESFELDRDIDPEIAELMEDGLVIDPKMGKHDGNDDSHTVYKYYLTDNGRISSAKETVKNEDPPDATDDPSEEGERSPEEGRQKQKDQLVSTLNESKVKDLRWPCSNFYIKEVGQDFDEVTPDTEEALPSYRSTAASASHPGRKRNVMLGRVWWVEWWAREDTRMKKVPDKSYSL